MAIEVSARNPRSVKALMIFSQCERWQTGHTKTGRSFFGIPSDSEAGLFHMTDSRECTCQDFRRRGSVESPCKHVMAVRLWMAAFQTGAVAPKRAAAATDLDDRIALTPVGAAYLVALSDAERDDAASETPAEHPQVAQLRTMLAHETCPDERESIAAKLDDTRAKIASVAERRRGIALLDRHLGDED